MKEQDLYKAYEVENKNKNKKDIKKYNLLKNLGVVIIILYFGGIDSLTFIVNIFRNNIYLSPELRGYLWEVVLITSIFFIVWLGYIAIKKGAKNSFLIGFILALMASLFSVFIVVKTESNKIDLEFEEYREEQRAKIFEDFKDNQPILKDLNVPNKEPDRRIYINKMMDIYSRGLLEINDVNDKNLPKDEPQKREYIAKMKEIYK